MRGYKANAIPSVPVSGPRSEVSSESGALSPDAASTEPPVARRAEAERRRELLGRIAASSSRGELRAIQAEVIAAYLGMAARRVSAEANVEQVRDAARERLRLMGPLAPVVRYSDVNDAPLEMGADESDARQSAD